MGEIDPFVSNKTAVSGKSLTRNSCFFMKTPVNFKDQTVLQWPPRNNAVFLNLNITFTPCSLDLN